MAYSAKRRAVVLADAMWCSDAEAARRHGVTSASVGKWRTRLETDAELMREYQELVTSSVSRWRRSLEDVAAQSASDLASMQARLHALVVDVMDHPEKHLDEHGAAPTTLDRIRIGQEVLGALLATLETSTELLTHYAAIVAEEDPLATQAHREDGAAPSSGAAGARGTGTS